MKYLSPADIAEELGVSRSRAYEIARECTRLVTGRSVRVRSDDWERWKKEHEVCPESRSTAGAKSGGASNAKSPTTSGWGMACLDRNRTVPSLLLSHQKG